MCGFEIGSIGEKYFSKYYHQSIDILKNLAILA
jgi:hypothetical protein